MPEFQPTNNEYIRQIVKDELRYTTPRMAIVTEVTAHSEKGDDSNYEVDVKIVGSSIEVDGATADSRTLTRVPVAVTMDGASRGLEPGDLVLVEYLDGDSDSPVVTHCVYGDKEGERAPLTEPGDFRRRIGESSIIEIVKDDDGKRKLNLGRQPDDRDGIDMGLTFNLDDGGFCLMDGSENGLFFDGDGNAILKWDSMAMPILADGDVNFQSGGGSSSGTEGTGFMSLASDSGMAEAESLAAGMQTTSLAGASAVRESDTAGLGATPRLPTTWTEAALTATHVPEPVTSEAVNLYDEGLRPGDVIDPYLEEFVRSNTWVQIPAGRYYWRGDGFTGNYTNTAVIGRGGLVELQQVEDARHQSTVTVSGGGPGSLLLANIAIRGTSAVDGALLRVQVTDDMSSAVLDGLYLPDGGTGDESVGIGVSPGHLGELYVRNSYVAGFLNGGLHASAPGMASGDDGPVYVEGGLYRGNGTANVRVGSTTSAVRAVTVESRGPAASRGIWVTESGTDVDIADCDIVQTESAPAVQMSSPTGTTTGTVTTTRITNDANAPAISVGTGHTWSGEDVHLTGDGDLSVVGGDVQTVTGEAAYPAATTPRRID